MKEFHHPHGSYEVDGSKFLNCGHVIVDGRVLVDYACVVDQDVEFWLFLGLIGEGGSRVNSDNEVCDIRQESADTGVGRYVQVVNVAVCERGEVRTRFGGEERGDHVETLEGSIFVK